MAALADAGGEIGRGVTLEADRENAPRRRRDAGLQKIGGALCEELGLPRTGAGDDRAVVGGADHLDRVRFEGVDTDRLPIVGSNPSRKHRHGQSRRRHLAIWLRSSESNGGMSSRKALVLMWVSAARCVAGLLFVMKW